MVSQDLLSYIHDGIQAGQSRDDITLNLVTSGWAGVDIDEAFRQIQNNDSANLPKQNNSKVENQLPSVVNLFKESWMLFKSTLVSFLKLVGWFTVFFSVLSILIAMLAFIFSVFHANPLDTNFSNVASVAKTLLTIIIVLITLIFLAFFVVVVAPVIQISNIILLNSRGTLPIRTIIKNSRSIAIPFFLTTAYASLVITGGVFALLIPGIYFAIIFMFVPFILVIENQKGKEALKRSYLLVKGRFWQVFLRVFIVSVTTFVVSLVVQTVAEKNTIVLVVFSVLNIFINWFASCYTFQLYIHLKLLPVSGKILSMRWIWVTAILGGLLIPLLFILMFFITILSINPNRQFAQSNDAKRRSDVNAILNASSQYAADNSGAVPTAVSTSNKVISKPGADLCSQLVPVYLAELPTDPLSKSKGTAIKDCNADYNTGYMIYRNGSGRITVSSPKGEIDKNISVNR